MQGITKLGVFLILLLAQFAVAAPSIYECSLLQLTEVLNEAEKAGIKDLLLSPLNLTITLDSHGSGEATKKANLSSGEFFSYKVGVTGGNYIEITVTSALRNKEVAWTAGPTSGKYITWLKIPAQFELKCFSAK
jgi:hypothetical protein